VSREFRFSEDIRHVLWKETLWHNALRAVAGGIVWALLTAVTGIKSNPAVPLFIIPITYFFFLLPAGLLASWLSFIPFVGLIAGFIALLVAVGDPLVYVLNQFQPRWVPIDRPDIFSLRIIVFVMSPFAE
jgi:hypothetical protein